MVLNFNIDSLLDLKGAKDNQATLPKAPRGLDPMAFQPYQNSIQSAHSTIIQSPFLTNWLNCTGLPPPVSSQPVPLFTLPFSPIMMPHSLQPTFAMPNLYQKEATSTLLLPQPQQPRTEVKTKGPLTDEQKRYLMDQFLIQPYPFPKDRNHFASIIGATSSQVERWFRKRRAQEKKEREEAAIGRMSRRNYLNH